MDTAIQHHLWAELRVGNDAVELAGNFGRVVGVGIEGSIATSLGHGRDIGCDNRSVATHRLKNGNAEPLEEGHISRSDGAGIERGKIGEIGIFLLLAAMLGASFDEPLPRDLPALAAALLFSLGNAALWGAWRGAWVRDMIAGLFLTILVYTLIRGLNRTESMDRKEWTAFGIGSAGIFLLQTVAVQMEGTVVKALDFASSVIWFAGILYFLVRIIRILRGDRPDEGLLSLVGAGYTWIICTMYLSGDPYYTIADLINTVVLFLTMVALERKWGETA